MIGVNFKSLSWAYFRRQKARFLRSLTLLRGRENAIRSGRTIPFGAGIPYGRGRQVEASVMFLDICGFSSRPSETKEQQHQILTAFALFFPEIISIIEDHGGEVEKNTGDGLMAYFVRVDEIGDVQRAITCSLTILHAAESLINPQLIELGIVPLSFRICIDRGLITVAKVGRKTGFAGFVAIGTTANLASKMLREADPMTLLLGDHMIGHLSQEWSQYVRLKTDNWGWLTSDGRPYALWEFDGRWITPTNPFQLGPRNAF